MNKVTDKDLEARLEVVKTLLSLSLKIDHWSGLVALNQVYGTKERHLTEFMKRRELARYLDGMITSANIVINSFK